MAMAWPRARVRPLLKLSNYGRERCERVLGKVRVDSSNVLVLTCYLQGLAWSLLTPGHEAYYILEMSPRHGTSSY